MGVRFLNNSESNFRKCEKHSTRSFAYPSLQLSWMLNDLTRLKIKLNEIISQGVLQYHCIHYRVADSEMSPRRKFSRKLSRLTKQTRVRQFIHLPIFKQLSLNFLFFSFLSFSPLFFSQLSLFQNNNNSQLRCNYISPRRTLKIILK